MIIPHDDRPLRRGYYSKVLTHTIFGAEDGAAELTLWEQFIPPGGYVVAHTHPVEETLTLLTGALTLTLDGETQLVAAPATIGIPAGSPHQFHNHADEPVRLIACLATNAPTLDYVDGPPTPVVWDDDA